MTGYQEILTDPSYCRQIVTLTYPHIGNTGVNAEDVESPQRLRRRPRSSATCRCSRRTGAPARSRCRLPAAQTTSSASPTSTRASSRASCARRARRTAASWPAQRRRRAPALAQARALPGPGRHGPRQGRDRATSPTNGREGRWAARQRLRASWTNADFHVVAFDYGIKRNILRMLAERGCARHRGAGADARARGAAR